MTTEFVDFMTQNAAALDTVALKSSVFTDQINAARGAMEKFKELQPIIDGFNSLRGAIENITTSAGKNMYQSFLETGVITDELAAKIRAFGGDLSKFEYLSGLVQINNQFTDLVQHFKDTGEVLPGLRQMFIDFGGDLAALDNTAALPGLMKGLDGINSLIGSLKQLASQFDPIQQILSGVWGPDTWGGLAGMGLDPSKLTGITDLIKYEKGWDQAIQDFQKTGKLAKGGILEQGLWQFGGTAGISALQQYGKGFNTITPDLLAATKAAMDASYQSTIKNALDYLGKAQQQTTDAIDTMTSAVTAQFDVVGRNIGTAISNAATSVIAELDLILGAINKQITDAGDAATTNKVAYYNAQGQPYTNENTSYWRSGGQWYQGATGGKITPIDIPPWESDVSEPGKGGKNIPHAQTGGLVRVHDEEAILDRDQTRRLLRSDSEAQPAIAVYIDQRGSTINGEFDMQRAVEKALGALRARGLKVSFVR
jgi:hypothetical protein